MHGLTRNGRDFDFISAQLSGYDNFRVLSIDVLGRGNSDRLDVETEYSYPSYVRLVKEWLSTVISQIFEENTNPTIYWVGTSMGGLIGTMISATVNYPIIKKLVLNDIGPFVSGKGIERIKEYCGSAPTLNSIEEATAYIKKIFKPFDPLTDDQWEYLVRVSVEQKDDKFFMRYDPLITNQLVCCFKTLEIIF